MTWWTTLLDTGRERLRPDRAMADPTALARAAAALVAATALGQVLLDPATAALLATGAFLCGLGTLINPLRHHAVNALGMAAALAALAALGALAQPAGWLSPLVLALTAAGAGTWRALGRAPGIRACLCVVGLLITTELAPDLAGGLRMTTWIAAGAALVVLAQLFPPYGSRHPAQRQSLAALYDGLAAAATEPSGPIAAAPFAAARRSLEVLPPRVRPQAAALYGLLGEGERLRRTIQSVRGQEDVPTSVVRDVLTGIARTVESGRPHETTEQAWERLDAWVHHSPAQSPRALVTRLREADRLARTSTSDRAGERTWQRPDTSGTRTAINPVRRTAHRLLAELTPHAPVFRHSLRLAGGVALGDLLGRTVGAWDGIGPSAHGFWAALAALLVLFPDYGSTIARGWNRAAGAVLGGALAAALAQTTTPGPGLAVLSAVLGLAAFLTMRRGQLVLNLWLTTWVVLLAHSADGPAASLAWPRAADVAIGAALAMLVFLVWPTWSASRLLDRLTTWLRLLDRLLPALATAHADPNAADRTEIDRLRTRARQEQSQLEAAILRAEAEPAWHRSPWTAEQLRRVQTEVHRVSRHTSQLTEHLPADASQAVPEFAELGTLLHEHLAELVRTAAGRRPVRPGELRAAFDAFTERTELGQGAMTGDRQQRAVALCGGMIDGLEDLASALATRPVRRDVPQARESTETAAPQESRTAP